MKFKAGDILINKFDTKRTKILVMGFDEHGHYLINYLDDPPYRGATKMVEHSVGYIDESYKTKETK